MGEFEMARKDDSRPPEAGETTSKRITALDIQQKEFRVSFRGYNEREVDEFLDVVTEELARLHAENKRLQEQGEYRQTLPLGGEAEDVLRRAKEEAERIVAEARSRSASLSGGMPGSGPVAPAGFDTAEAVNRYLAREREFLQSLASKIHQHIEAVKEDAREVRAAGAAAAAPGASSPSDASFDPAGSADPGSTGEEASGGPGLEDTAMHHPISSPETDTEPQASDATRDRVAGIEAGPAETMEASSTPEGDDGPPPHRWDGPPVGRLEGDPAARTRVAERHSTETAEIMPLREIASDPAGDGPPLADHGAGVSAANGKVGQSPPESLSATQPPDDSEDERSLRELFWGED
jgi:DivIVA domain-containing protein